MTKANKINLNDGKLGYRHFLFLIIAHCAIIEFSLLEIKNVEKVIAHMRLYTSQQNETYFL